MKKRPLYLLALICAATLAVACGKQKASETSGSAASGTESTTVASSETAVAEAARRTVTDDSGAVTEIPEKIDRIVVGDVFPMASVLSVYLGSADKIVGIHPVSMSAAQNGLLGDLYPEILKAETGFAKGNELNVEEVMKLNPDIVIGVTKDNAEALRNAGIPAICVIPSKYNFDVIATYEQWISLLDQIFGGSEKTAQIEAYSRKAYELVQERVRSLKEEEKKRVLVLFRYDDSGMVASGKNFFGQYWTDAVGAINVAAEIPDGKMVQINMEQVYQWNPDLILITNFTGTQPEDLYENRIGSDDWSKVKAVQNHEVYKMPLGIYRTFTPGADTPVTLQWLAKTVYPEKFADLDIDRITREYFAQYYNVELTDEMLKKMYNPSKQAAEGMVKK